ncbi:MAG: DUF2158 domain-containing protein [Armatimonadetes bacterium]|nr:DUF2158 domain-containing protein [Armatimonadota bacterium]
MNEQTDIKAGDTVRLKSGGPTMTVDSIGDYMGSRLANCIWFSGTKKQTGQFAPDSLEKSAE